eukprot:TRINITY_DN5570_c0_g1_i1.p1 TRINITY_DN5570_c0_g1~~TRINITY_DN5570_c0_g1_i1.p1  ORF type:complete len:299 (+),score=109.15 TRINITY_DN5570_c0_g1_i1:140-1036(+)
MQHDDMVWQVLNHSFCSYKAKTRTQTFCRNRYNLTGLCSRQACPLSNSRYATVIEKQGVLYLYMKTIERAHTPANLWERVKLKKNFVQALQQIDTNLAYWPNFIRHKVKQRMVKIRQYLIRMRKIKLNTKTKLVTVNKKLERREAVREEKSLEAADIENAITKEILARFNSQTYPEDIHNFNPKLFEKALAEEHAESDEDEDEDEDEPEVETVEEFIEEEDYDDLEDAEYGMEGDDDDEDDERQDDESDEEELSNKKRKAPISKKKPKPPPTKKGGASTKRTRVEIEYEQEQETANNF